MTITILTSNQAALLAIGHPQQQSGQGSIKQIYEKVRAWPRGNLGLYSGFPRLTIGRFRLFGYLYCWTLCHLCHHVAAKAQ
jgi:hypothetical protein